MKKMKKKVQRENYSQFVGEEGAKETFIKYLH